ncbi:hypothetical protein J2X31_003670 [Flavobacterium arsenatis]|uniref:Peptidase S74 domain-containing protein n=1 Tax=Flavobacterium arsenatis TaxID=1484332 RepID=A0ABU1TUS6_9FLAO|nr:hypothetical protein [Flavobacterium arsenatis]MDR6969637.1 hypothetical protein [Flavobacterium arsenatis]
MFKRNNVEAGRLSTNSVFFGVGAGSNSTTTFGGNTFVGTNSGVSSTGSSNTFLGNSSGNQFNGLFNLAIGKSAGNNSSGNGNILIGTQAGEDITGDGNLLLGFLAGAYSNFNNKLIISSPIYEDNGALIWGDFEQLQLKFNAKVGIGYNFGNYPSTAGSVDVSNYDLFVKGGILTEAVRVTLQSTWADYVFEKDYKLPSLDEVEKHIEEKGHLMNVPSAKDVEENGIELGEMARIQQEKIEELTLYIIEQNKINENQNKEIEKLKIALQVLLETTK